MRRRSASTDSSVSRRVAARSAIRCSGDCPINQRASAMPIEVSNRASGGAPAMMASPAATPARTAGPLDRLANHRTGTPPARRVDTAGPAANSSPCARAIPTPALARLAGIVCSAQNAAARQDSALNSRRQAGIVDSAGGSIRIPVSPAIQPRVAAAVQRASHSPGTSSSSPAPAAGNATTPARTRQATASPQAAVPRLLKARATYPHRCSHRNPADSICGWPGMTSPYSEPAG